MSAALVRIAPVVRVRASALPEARAARIAAPACATSRRFESASPLRPSRTARSRGDATRVRVAHPDEGFTDGNPLATGVADLRLRLLHLFPQVTMLDGVAADCDERVCAHNMHGDDADDLIAIRREYFGISLIDAEAQQRSVQNQREYVHTVERLPGFMQGVENQLMGLEDAHHFGTVPGGDVIAT